MGGGVPASAVPGGLQNANMAAIELGKKRMRDSNDDLLMVPRLMHELHTFPFVAGNRDTVPRWLSRFKFLNSGFSPKMEIDAA